MKMIHIAITNMMVQYPAVLTALNMNENPDVTAGVVNPENALAAAGIAVLAGAVIYIKRHMRQ